MKLTKLFLIALVIIILCYGCQNSSQKEEHKPLQQITPAMTVPPTQSSLVYLAELMNQRRYVLNNEFKAFLQDHERYLRFGETIHSKPHSIFHHPIGMMPNTISFTNVYIPSRTSLRFSIGIFSNNHHDFASDGVTFLVFLKQHDQTRMLFQETIQVFDTWKDVIIDLSEYASQEVTLQLQTDSYRTSAYDWAVWGAPCLLPTPGQAYSVKEFTAVERREFLGAVYSRDLPLTEKEKWIERGWLADTVTTDIILPVRQTFNRIRNEIFVLERSNNSQETVTIAYLDRNDSIVASSEHHVSDRYQVIQSEYEIQDIQKIPAKVRVTLDRENPSIIFVKEPVFYTLRVSEDEQQRPNIILISLDTLRADRLSCYGYERDTSPNIDALAADGFVFKNAYSNSNWTLPAHTSMFTSLYPSQHQIGLRNHKTFNFYTEKWPYYYMTEGFRDVGYLTFALTGGVLVDYRYGFHRGFDYYAQNYSWECDEHLITSVTQFLAHYTRSTQFVFFHTYEIHEYYQERASSFRFVPEGFQRENISVFRDVFGLNEIVALMMNDWDVPKSRKARDKFLSKAGFQYISDLYDGAIFYTDTLIGKLIQELKELQLYENSWIVITSDHGEGLGELHGDIASWHHGSRLYDDQIKIPLIIKPPRSFMQGEPVNGIIHEYVETIDLPPTLFAMAEIGGHEQFQGRNMLPLLRGEKLQEASTAIFSEFVDRRDFSIIKDHFKMIMVPLNDSLQKMNRLLTMNTYRYQLYDLSQDPTEENDFINSAKHVAMINELKDLLWQHIGDLLNPACLEPVVTENVKQSQEIDAEHIKRLKELGYVQ